MNVEKDKIGFIGAGNMGTALIKGLVESSVYDKDRILASDKNEAALKGVSEQFGVGCCSSNGELVGACSNLVLAVKPQSMREVLEEVRGEIRDDHLIISIAAGIPLKMIRSIIGRDLPLIRVMPNTPALIQKGISALAPGSGTTSEQVELARGVFEAVGETVIVEEEMMDAVTAVSGSGPGYVFRIMECLVHAGEKIGFDRKTALLLVIQTVLGAAHLADQSEKSLAQLREMVTSPGGTTAAALAAFEERGLEETIGEGVEAALNRGVELGKNY